MTTSSLCLIAAGLVLAASVPLSSAACAAPATGGTVTSHHAAHKAKHTDGAPSSPAPAVHQAVPPSERLQDEPNQIKDQVAPIPSAPVKPGSNVVPGQDTPRLR